MELDSQKLERKLLNLKDSQDSITNLSKWCLSKHTAHKQIVKSWLKILKEVKVEQRLSLFYLANDVIQHSKRKNYEFVESWATSLQRATTLVRDDKVKEKISRIFKIWEQREIYGEDFISDLHGLLLINSKPASQSSSTNILSNSQSQSSTGSSPITARSDEDEEEFQLPSVISNIRSCVSLEAETDKNLKLVVKANIPDVDKIRSNLKDRSYVKDVEKDLQSATKHYDDFINAINAEIRARKLLLTALDQADKFYRNQRRDVKKVVYAYKNFGDRIKVIQTELNQKATSLPSPIPSPDINAPSPEPDDNDFNLPMNDYYNPNGTFGSFLNNEGSLPFDVNEFYRESPPLHANNSQIPVLQSQESQQPAAPLHDFYNSLIPSKLDAYNPAMSFVDPYKQPPLPATEPSINVQAQHYVSSIPPPPPIQPAAPIDFFPPLPSASTSMNDDYLWNEWIDTPISPPSYERKAVGDTVEYVEESLRDIDSSLIDIDHRQLFGGDLESKEIDHRNLISLTGSPGMGNGKGINITNGSEKNFAHPPPDLGANSHQFNNFTGQQSSYPRNSRPALLPTPSMPPQRYNRNLSMMSDSSKSYEMIDTATDVDMELSDDDGMENKHADHVPDHRDFYQMPPQRFPQVNLNHPPPLIPPENVDQRKSWIHNNMDMDAEQEQNFMSPPPQNNRGGFLKGNFRGQNRGRINNGNFRGVRGRGGRGSFRGNNRGGQW